MNEKDFLKKLNNITYEEKDLELYVEKDSNQKGDDLYMRRYFITKAITHQEAYNYIHPKLRPSETVIHIMGFENMHGIMAQSALAIGTGAGALPFLNMNINAILIITTERLFVSIVDGDFQTGALNEYELNDVTYLKTAFDAGCEYLYIKIKGKKYHDFWLYNPDYDYKKLFDKLTTSLPKNKITLIHRDRKLSRRNRNSYIAYYIGAAIIVATIVYNHIL